jgi:hypothetical protein
MVTMLSFAFIAYQEATDKYRKAYARKAKRHGNYLDPFRDQMETAEENYIYCLKERLNKAAE